MQEAAKTLQASIPKGTGFVIITITGPDGAQNWNYISNCAREEMIEALEQLLGKWKQENPKNN